MWRMATKSKGWEVPKKTMFISDSLFSPQTTRKGQRLSKPSSYWRMFSSLVFIFCAVLGTRCERSETTVESAGLNEAVTDNVSETVITNVSESASEEVKHVAIGKNAVSN